MAKPIAARRQGDWIEPQDKQQVVLAVKMDEHFALFVHRCIQSAIGKVSRTRLAVVA